MSWGYSAPLISWGYSAPLMPYVYSAHPSQKSACSYACSIQGTIYAVPRLNTIRDTSEKAAEKARLLMIAIDHKVSDMKSSSGWLVCGLSGVCRVLYQVCIMSGV
ncbi:hypothetical protein CENSYa_0711 [Cenarchaeum symbiosum A]|uniref:Uncharacterized protein n=1 Tax=Cenarchaeum symbiosum (strain A) TaxID=414004 RepID=A0RVH7_CENSY|nr:hypothetical protein CENSYa_0711 [Cenarchaeum symbiosum A]